MSGSLRPSAGYMGRGVIAMSAEEYMLYHQNSFAQVNDASRLRAASQIFSPSTSRLDWRHSQISERSRKYHPLPTMPCSRGKVPVTKVDCTVVVTAGVTVRRLRTVPCFASAPRCGAWTSSAGVMPTTFSTSVRFMSAPPADLLYSQRPSVLRWSVARGPCGGPAACYVPCLRCRGNIVVQLHRDFNARPGFRESARALRRINEIRRAEGYRPMGQVRPALRHCQSSRGRSQGAPPARYC